MMIANANVIGNKPLESAASIAQAFVNRIEADGGLVEARDCLESRIELLRTLGLWNKASAVWLPHGYKEDKLYAVKGGDAADLTFARAGTRTRKGPSYIEHVPYNLFTRSEELDASSSAWAGVGTITITPDAALSPVGTLTADRLETSGLASRFQTTALSIGSEYTISGYFKAVTPGINNIFRLYGDSNIASGDFIATGEWQRFSFTFTVITGGSRTAGITRPTGDANTDLYVWGMQLVVGSEAGDYFMTTNRFDVPALDYTNNTCPALSLEPARTNLLLRSEEFDNASWVSDGATGTIIIANQTIAPNGLSAADKINDTGNNTRHALYQALSISSGTVYTFSVFAKSAGQNRRLGLAGFGVGGADEMPVFNLETGVVTLPPTNTVLNSASMIDVGDGWYRCVITVTSATSVGQPEIFNGLSSVNNLLSSWTYVGAGGTGFYIWGAQVEAGSYATSYIPTTTATVSRLVDSVTGKTSFSDYIGQTEGSIFIEVQGHNGDTATGRVSISDGTVSNVISINLRTTPSLVSVTSASTTGGGAGASIGTSSLDLTTKTKICVTYAENDVSLFVNGVKAGNDTSAAIPLCSRFGFDRFDSNVAGLFYGFMYQTSLFKTKLSDAEAIALTTP